MLPLVAWADYTVKDVEKKEFFDKLALKAMPVLSYWGSRKWAQDQTKYLLGLFSDKSTWNLPHNWHFKRLVAFIIIERLKEAGFDWHVEIASGHFHRWLARKDWEASV